MSSIKINNRKSNMELLRIISMFFIVIHHCLLHGGGKTGVVIVRV